MTFRACFAFLFVFLPLVASAKFIGRDESFVCPDQKLSSATSVVCCDTLENQSCDATIKILLSEKQSQFLSKLTETIMSWPIEKNSAPSCFATSMVLANQPIANPFQYSGDRELVANLAASYTEISNTSELRPGDILIFDEQGDFFMMEDDETGRKKYHWEFDTLIAHAMYYLGNGLVVQKENAMTAVSSISTLDRAFARYSWGLETTQHVRTMDYAHKKTKLVLRVYRLTTRL